MACVCDHRIGYSRIPLVVAEHSIHYRQQYSVVDGASCCLSGLSCIAADLLVFRIIRIDSGIMSSPL